MTIRVQRGLLAIGVLEPATLRDSKEQATKSEGRSLPGTLPTTATMTKLPFEYVIQVGILLCWFYADRFLFKGNTFAFFATLALIIGLGTYCQRCDRFWFRRERDVRVSGHEQ